MCSPHVARAGRIGLALGLGWLSACSQVTPTAPLNTSPPSSVATSVAARPDSATPAANATRAIFIPFISGDFATPLAPVAAPPATETPAPLPTPAPSPTLDWPAPLAGLTASKLGIHAVGTGDTFVMEHIRRAKPRVVKAVGDVGWLREVKEVSPEIVTVGRLPAEQSEWIGTVDPAQAGQAYVEINLQTYQLNPFVDYWEGWNEFVPADAARMQWFARFEASRACEMQARGFRAAVGGFSVGVPEYALMADFLPALEAARRCGGVFHLHEYNAPTLACGVGTGTPGLIPGAPAIGVPAGPLTLRYRFWYEGYLKPRGWGDLKLIISELGVDGVSGTACGGPGALGWKPYGEWWAQNGIGPDAHQSHVNVLAWYDAEMRKDAYVLGATVFTSGAIGARDIWHAFDMHDMLLPLAKYLVTQQ